MSLGDLLDLRDLDYDFDDHRVNQRNLARLRRQYPNLEMLVELYLGNRKRLRYALYEYDDDRSNALIEEILESVGIGGDDSVNDAINFLAFDTDATDTVVGAIMTPIRLELQRPELVQLFRNTEEIYPLLNFINLTPTGLSVAQI